MAKRRSTENIAPPAEQPLVAQLHERIAEIERSGWRPAGRVDPASPLSLEEIAAILVLWPRHELLQAIGCDTIEGAQGRLGDAWVAAVDAVLVERETVRLIDLAKSFERDPRGIAFDARKGTFQKKNRAVVEAILTSPGEKVDLVHFGDGSISARAIEAARAHRWQITATLVPVEKALAEFEIPATKAQRVLDLFDTADEFAAGLGKEIVNSRKTGELPNARCFFAIGRAGPPRDLACSIVINGLADVFNAHIGPDAAKVYCDSKKDPADRYTPFARFVEAVYEAMGRLNSCPSPESMEMTLKRRRQLERKIKKSTESGASSALESDDARAPGRR